jgi:hypothetical protein
MAAKSRFEAGDYDAANGYALALNEMLAEGSKDPELNREAEAVYVVLGRLALLDGDVEEAKRRLAEAGRLGGSPTRSSFGPNMSLAHDLLLAGEREAVLDFLKACEAFWPDHEDELAEWTMYIEAGRLPDFGANMNY